MIEPSVKAAVARRQLGTALALFLADDDPVSVHCLACGGGEIADFLAKDAGAKPFSQHALEVHPNMKESELVSLRNQYWNAMKHAFTRYGKVRSDGELLAGFNDEHNDHVLYIGWHDYASAVGRLPIEAQAFQVWYFANFPEKLADEHPILGVNRLFPGIRDLKRSEKKRALNHKISWARRQRDIMQDPRTERRKLILERMAAPLPTL